MGSLSSKFPSTTTKETQRQIDTLLAQFSEDERVNLIKVFERIFVRNNDDFGYGSGGTAKQKPREVGAVSAKDVNADLPTFLSSTLKTSFIRLFQLESLQPCLESSSSLPLQEDAEKLSSEPIITKLGIVSAIHKLSQSTLLDQAQTAFIVCCNEGSVKAFVEDVTKAVLIYWFQGTFSSELSSTVSLSSTSLEALKPGDQLIEYLLIAPRLPRGDPEDEEKTQEFLKECDIDRYFTEDAFIAWFTANLPLQNLLKILVTRVFLVSSSLYPLADLRSQRLLSPPISTHLSIPKLSNLISPADYYFLTEHLPSDCLTSSFPHTLIFSSKRDGDSWHTFISSISYKGSTVLIIKDKDGYVFGGFAYEDWEVKPKFYGSDRNFVFTLNPRMRWFPDVGINQNWQYLCWGTETLENGIGMGGQLDYFALWIASDFFNGHSKAAPLSSTYMSPQLSKQERFKVDEVEVWLVKPTSRSPDDIPQGPKHSALDRNPAELDLLEMATNRKAYSKYVREPDVFSQDNE